MSHLVTRSFRPLALAALLAVPALAAPGNGWCHLTPWAPEAPAALDFYGWTVELGDSWAFVLNRGTDTIDVYQRDGGTWSRVQSLVDPQGGSQFGADIELHGDDLYVGAPTSDLAGQAAGAVHRYQLVDGIWDYAGAIVSPWADPFDRFGQSVSADDGWLAVGVLKASPEGAVDVFKDVGGTWVGQSRLQHPDTVTLGNSVEIRGTADGIYANVFAGDTNALGHTGAVFHFRVHPFGYQWGPAIQSPFPSIFGYGVDIDFDGEHLVVGASWEEQQGVSTGAAYVFDIDGEVFPPDVSLADTLLPEPGQAGSEFGKHVAIEGGRIAVGAPHAFTTGEVARPGAVYVFRPEIFGAGWQLEDRLFREGGQDGDMLGSPVAISGSQVLSGAWNAGVGTVGEVVLFSLTSKQMDGGLAPSDVLATIEMYGEGKPGALGVPELWCSQPPVPGESSLMGLSNVPAGTQPLVLWSLQSAATPFDQGVLLVGQPSFVIALPTVTQLNQVGWNWNVPNDLNLVGVEVFAQAMLVDPNGFGPRQTAQSQGMKVIVGY